MEPSSNVMISDDLSKVLAKHKYTFKRKISVKNSAPLKMMLEKAEYKKRESKRK